MTSVAAYLHEAEGVIRSQRLSEDGKRAKLEAIRSEVERLGGDPKAVPSLSGPPAERRATRESKRAAGRRSG